MTVKVRRSNEIKNLNTEDRTKTDFEKKEQEEEEKKDSKCEEPSEKRDNNSGPNSFIQSNEKSLQSFREQRRTFDVKQKKKKTKYLRKEGEP